MNNQTVVHNLFLENADVWTGTHDWVMTEERFKKVYGQWQQSKEEDNIKKAIEWCDVRIESLFIRDSPVATEKLQSPYLEIKLYLKSL